MVYPLLPVFLRHTLGASVLFVGLVEGIAETTASLLKLFSGWWVDRVGRHKAFTFGGYALAGATRPLMALVTAPWQVLALRFLDRVGKGIRTSPRDALLASACEEHLRGLAFGFHRAMDHLGALIGPLLASAVLLFAPGNLRLVFALAAVPALLSLVVLWFGIAEVKPQRSAAPTPFPLTHWQSFDRRFYWFLAAVLLFTLSNASDAFLLLRAKDCGVPEAALPLLWTWLHIVKSLSSTPGGSLSDRWGRVPTMLLGWGIYAFVYAVFALVSAPWQVWALFTVYGLYFGLTEGTERALVADLVPSALRGSGYGAYHFVVGLGMLPASLLFGALWYWQGAPVAFGVCATLAVSAAALLALTVRIPHPVSQ